MQIKYRKLYGFAALVCWLMMLGTAGSADAGYLEGGALFVRLVPQLIGMMACTRCAMG